MTPSELIAMAKQAGFNDADGNGVWITDGTWTKELEIFAKLVAEKEREECAKLCEVEHGFYGIAPAEDIRARGLLKEVKND